MTYGSSRCPGWELYDLRDLLIARVSCGLRSVLYTDRAQNIIMEGYDLQMIYIRRSARGYKTISSLAEGSNQHTGTIP